MSSTSAPPSHQSPFRATSSYDKQPIYAVTKIDDDGTGARTITYTAEWPSTAHETNLTIRLVKELDVDNKSSINPKQPTAHVDAPWILADDFQVQVSSPEGGPVTLNMWTDHGGSTKVILSPQEMEERLGLQVSDGVNTTAAERIASIIEVLSGVAITTANAADFITFMRESYEVHSADVRERADRILGGEGERHVFVAESSRRPGIASSGVPALSVQTAEDVIKTLNSGASLVWDHEALNDTSKTTVGIFVDLLRSLPKGKQWNAQRTASCEALADRVPKVTDKATLAAQPKDEKGNPVPLEKALRFVMAGAMYTPQELKQRFKAEGKELKGDRASQVAAVEWLLKLYRASPESAAAAPSEG